MKSPASMIAKFRGTTCSLLVPLLTACHARATTIANWTFDTMLSKSNANTVDLDVTGDLSLTFPHTSKIRAVADTNAFMPFAVCNAPMQVGNLQLTSNVKWVFGDGDPAPEARASRAGGRVQFILDEGFRANRGAAAEIGQWPSGQLVSDGFQIEPPTNTSAACAYVLAPHTTNTLGPFLETGFTLGTRGDVPSVTLTNESGGAMGDPFAGFGACFTWHTMPAPSGLTMLSMGLVVGACGLARRLCLARRLRLMLGLTALVGLPIASVRGAPLTVTLTDDVRETVSTTAVETPAAFGAPFVSDNVQISAHARTEAQQTSSINLLGGHFQVQESIDLIAQSITEGEIPEAVSRFDIGFHIDQAANYVISGDMTHILSRDPSLVLLDDQDVYLRLGNSVSDTVFFQVFGSSFTNSGTLAAGDYTLHLRGLADVAEGSGSGEEHQTLSMNLQLSPVPEPSSFVLLVLGGSATFMAIRKLPARLGCSKAKNAAAPPKLAPATIARCGSVVT
jgi:hypothetical protein